MFYSLGNGGRGGGGALSGSASERSTGVIKVAVFPAEMTVGIRVRRSPPSQELERFTSEISHGSYSRRHYYYRRARARTRVKARAREVASHSLPRR